MKPRTTLIVGLLIVLTVLVVYAIVKKPQWSFPEFWRANFVDTPRKVYSRSAGTLDEEAALAFDRATSGRNPSPSDHFLAATIITNNIIGQEHRPELDRAGNPTNRAVELAQLRHEMFVQAREHYMAALQGLTRQMGQPPAAPTAGGRPTRAARRAARTRRRAAPPPPADAGFMVDAALDFAIGGAMAAMQNDPLLVTFMNGGGPDHGMDHGDVLAQMTLFIDMGLAGAANQTRERVVDQRREAAQRAAAEAGGGAGAQVEAYMNLAVQNTDDPENSHDSGVNGCLRAILKRLRGEQPELAALPTLDMIKSDISKNQGALVDGDGQVLAKVLAVVDRAGNGEKNVAIDATDGEVLRRIWARADDPLNAPGRDNLRRASVDALKDSWKQTISGPRIVCVNGRTSRQLGALSMVDHDRRNWEVTSFEQFKNEVFEKTKALVADQAAAAAASSDPQLAKCGKSYQARTGEELDAIGDIDDAAAAAFASDLKAKVGDMVDAFVVEVNTTRSDGAIPVHMVGPLKMEAQAAIS